MLSRDYQAAKRNRNYGIIIFELACKVRKTRKTNYLNSKKSINQLNSKHLFQSMLINCVCSVDRCWQIDVQKMVKVN